MIAALPQMNKGKTFIFCIFFSATVLHSTAFTVRPSIHRTRVATRNAKSSAITSNSIEKLVKGHSMSSEVQDDERRPDETSKQGPNLSERSYNAVHHFFETLNKEMQLFSRKLPPFQVEDNNLLLYDIVLIVNLAVSISFFAVHRMNYSVIGLAFNEGCLMSLLWMASGLYTGAFLYSAVDGHYVNDDDHTKGGPKAAALLAFQTYMNAVNLRLLFALIVAVVEHRPVGAAGGEQLMPLEIGFGLILMSVWRGLHSSFVPRI